MLVKILAINLLVFVVYVLLITLNPSVTDKGFNIAIGMGMCIFVQVVANGIIGITCLVLDKKEVGKSFLISAAVLVPLGFVTWLMLLSVFG